jgi:hypothetical protein
MGTDPGVLSGGPGLVREAVTQGKQSEGDDSFWLYKGGTWACSEDYDAGISTVSP